MTLDHQRAVSELLRSADKAIKDGNLDNALAAISRVFEFDQRNVYARAYQERILSLKEMQIATRANAEKIPADSARNVQASDFSIPRAVPAAPKEPSPAFQHKNPYVNAAPPAAPPAAPAAPAPPPGAAVKAPAPAPVPAKPSVFVALPETDPGDTSATAAPEAPPAVDTRTASPEGAGSGSVSSPFEYTKHTPARLEAFKTLLAEIWADGSMTDLEEERITALKKSFGITDDEHTGMEREIRFDAYLAAIERAWKKGITGFEEMRKQYRISDQEHLQIEGRVFRLLQSLRSVGTVLIIDDDAEFLQLASRQLTEAGYYCVAVPTCEEALFVLESLTPNVVVCDVNFTKPNMSGFAFFEKFRGIEKFFHVPFIFLSGMVQEAVQRTGMQMGADSYFTKPIDLELFLATIEGRIKRSYEVQQRLSPHRL